MVGKEEFALEMMFNFNIAENDGPWRKTSFSVLPPACLPPALSHLGSAIVVEARGREEWLLRGAVFDGIEFTLRQLQSICSSLDVPLPAKGKGSGKRGLLVKRDYANSLIRFLYPLAPDSEFERMMKLMVGNLPPPTDVNLLAWMAELDVDNADAFEHLKKQALEQLERDLFGQGHRCGIEEADTREKQRRIQEKADAKAKELKRKERAAEELARKKQYDLTPTDLKALLPGNGSIRTIFWARYHPIQRFFRTDYPTGSLDSAMRSKKHCLLSCRFVCNPTCF